jgi:hypothetical protein
MSIFGGRQSSVDETKLRHSFAKIREELEEHLQAINESTAEIAQNHQYAVEMEAKLDTLAERVERMELFLKQTGYGSSNATFHVQPLTTDEKRVFVALYTIEEEKGHVTYADVSSALLMDMQLVAGYVASLMEKGVPLVKRYVNNVAYLKLDQDFKQLQAKENILGIDKAQKQLVQF